jgi:hypothetical protein
LSATNKRIQATNLSDQSWLLTEWGNRLGLLSNRGDGFKLIVKGKITQYSSLELLCAQEKWTIEWVKPAEPEPEQEVFLSHLPIKHLEAHDVEMGPPITYSKQAGSSVRFAAGYWGLRFSHAWTAAFCPKTATLGEYDHVGPFSTKLELNTVLAQKNKQKTKGEPV